MRKGKEEVPREDSEVGGQLVGVATGNVTKFLGIPYAQPPTGDLRFRLPQPNTPYSGTLNASAFGSSCPQQATTVPVPDSLPLPVAQGLVQAFYGIITPDQNTEDCLTLNVVVPASAQPTSKLPVGVWIYGGSFELGGTSQYDGGVIVQRSIDLGQPIIYVSINYRLSAFGFLAGEEVKKAGVANLGLQDQRQALRWVQKYIGAFGGDPTKVTLWGESAGAMSIGYQMVGNDGDNEGLFRAAFMQSGSPLPVGDISHGQPYYDALVQRTGCTATKDTLACLRNLPLAQLRDAVDKSPSMFAFQSLNFAWMPRADGTFIKKPAQTLVQEGKVANIPFITGDVDDEGTLFTLSNINVTTDQEVSDYMKSTYFPKIAKGDLQHLLSIYTSNASAGSPFDTGDANAITPQFKRLAALHGDVYFQAPRRFFLDARADKQKTWSFLSKRSKAFPVIGAVHASDIPVIYGPADMTDYLIRFVATLDPNGGGAFNWPLYTAASPQLLTFLDGNTPLAVTQDTFRADGIAFLTKLSLAQPL